MKWGWMRPNREKIARFILNRDYRRLVLGNNLRLLREKSNARFRGVAPPPKMVVAQITGACNRRCLMCTLWGDKGAYHHLESKNLHFPFATFEKLYQEMLEFRPCLSFMGGEPLVHPEFRQIMDLIASGPLPLSIPTNGVLVEKHLELLLRPYVETVEISLDAPAELHDKIRGMTGTFDKAIRGLAQLIENRQAKGHPRINIRTTISDYNYDQLEALADILQDYDFDLWTIQHLMFNQQEVIREHVAFVQKHMDIYLSEENLGLPPAPDKIEVELLLEQLNRLKSRSFPFALITNPAYPDDLVRLYYRDGEKIPPPGLLCKVPFEQLSFDFSGNFTLSRTSFILIFRQKMFAFFCQL